MMDFLRRWWWPTYAFVYPLALRPGVPTQIASFGVLAWLTALFVAGGLVLELTARPEARLSDLRHLPRALRRHPAPALALAYGLWAVFAAFFSPEPNAAFIGNTATGDDGAVWALGLSVVFALVYVRAVSEAGLVGRVVRAVVAAGGSLALWAVVEVVGRHSLLDPSGDAYYLPVATFAGAGHLAGFLTLAVGLAAGLWGQGLVWALVVQAPLAFAVGLSGKRAAMLALAVGALASWRRPRALFTAAAVLGLGIAGGLASSRWLATGDQRTVTGGESSLSRLDLWEAALGGIKARPVLGWGGGVFQDHFASFVSSASLSRMLEHEGGLKGKLVSHQAGFFLVRTDEGKLKSNWVVFWKAHSQLMDVTLMRGLVGLGLYLALLWVCVRRPGPAAWGVVAYHIFLLVWYLPVQAEGVLWAVLSVAAVESLALESKKVRRRQAQPVTA